MTKIFDAEKFNSDPAFDAERSQFDAMFEGSFARYLVKHKKPEEESENIFDVLFGGKKEVEK